MNRFLVCSKNLATNTMIGGSSVAGSIDSGGPNDDGVNGALLSCCIHGVLREMLAARVLIQVVLRVRHGLVNTLQGQIILVNYNRGAGRVHQRLNACKEAE